MQTIKSYRVCSIYRFDCKQRMYKYWFPAGDLDVASMKSACKLFLGSHDFRNICKMDVANGVTSFIRCIHSIDILANAENNSSNDGKTLSIFHLNHEKLLLYIFYLYFCLKFYSFETILVGNNTVYTV